MTRTLHRCFGQLGLATALSILLPHAANAADAPTPSETTPAPAAPPATDAAPAATPAPATPTPAPSAAPAANPAPTDSVPSESTTGEPAASESKLAPPPYDVARWPDRAYPNQTLRGIRGGSLWFNFHGLQWPTSPFDESDPSTRLGFSGYGWLDTGYKSVTTEQAGVANTHRWVQQGRFVLRATPTYTHGDWFVQLQGELAANQGQSQTQPFAVDVDDLWIRAGQWNRFDVQIGRYEAWELYHLGLGLDQYTFEREGAQIGPRTPPEFYGVTYGYYRQRGVGNVAAHLYPFKFLRLELLGQFGVFNNLNTVGLRPAGILDWGIVKVKAGLEYKKLYGLSSADKTNQTYKGSGGTVQVVLDPYLELGANFAYGVIDKIDVTGLVDYVGSTTTFSFGGFVNARAADHLIIGAGANYTRGEDLNRDGAGNVDESNQLQVFAAAQYALFDQLFVKLVGAYAKADFAPSHTPLQPSSDTMLSARLRLQYVF